MPLCRIDLERKDAMLAAWTALLADATEPARGPGASMDMLIFLVAPLALFVLFIVMPMKREARVRRELLSTLKTAIGSSSMARC